ncbi:MAG TPA: hypothetical protein ENJ79_03050 [Gammaproteobacteria bacterium]|nr:hypothetical protein [Gammaproteobacteria bacterium]
MKISLSTASGGYLIRAYEKGRLTINEESYAGSLILTPDRLIPDWRPQTVAELAAADFEPLMELRPGLVILGTGASQIFPPPALYAGLLDKGIGVEIMNTPAACRTYNILMAEGRAVAAALMML